VGINLLREGLDLPEVTLVAILDADKEGYLRSHRSLIQTAGRAARNLEGRVIFYADTITQSMRLALEETTRRRLIQAEYNARHGITPESITKSIGTLEYNMAEADYVTVGLAAEPVKDYEGRTSLDAAIRDLEAEMKAAAKSLEFEKAARLRDRIKTLRMKELEVDVQQAPL
jgi:excinuclease ABC subunit B